MSERIMSLKRLSEEFKLFTSDYKKCIQEEIDLELQNIRIVLSSEIYARWIPAEFAKTKVKSKIDVFLLALRAQNDPED